MATDRWQSGGQEDELICRNARSSRNTLNLGRNGNQLRIHHNTFINRGRKSIKLADFVFNKQLILIRHAIGIDDYVEHSSRDWNADVFVDMLGQRVVNVDHKSVAIFRDVALTDVELTEFHVGQWLTEDGQLAPCLGNFKKQFVSNKLLGREGLSDLTDSRRPEFSDIRSRPREVIVHNRLPHGPSPYRWQHRDAARFPSPASWHSSRLYW